MTSLMTHSIYGRHCMFLYQGLASGNTCTTTKTLQLKIKYLAPFLNKYHKTLVQTKYGIFISKLWNGKVHTVYICKCTVKFETYDVYM